jgi:hypothetical protein
VSGGIGREQNHEGFTVIESNRQIGPLKREPALARRRF